MKMQVNTSTWFDYKYGIGAIHSFNPENKKRYYKIMEYAKGNTILDVGCGQGVLVNLLTGKGFKATGVDFSNVALKFAKAGHYSPGGVIKTIGSFVYADITKTLPFKDQSFDCVCLCEVIEHFQHPEFLLVEAQRLTKPNGRILITVPFYKKEGHPEHVIDFTANSLFTLLNKFGNAHIEQVSKLHFVAYIDILK